MNPTFKNLAISVAVVCGLQLGVVRGLAQVTVKVDSTRPWIGWLNVFETNNAYVGGNPMYVAELPAEFLPANSPSGWPLNTHLILRPNTSTYNPGDPYWNLPDGSPNKVLEPHFYVDVYTEFAGQTVTFQGSVGSNKLLGLEGGPATGWEPIAFIKEFTPAYDYLGMTSVPLPTNRPFSVSRPIGPGNVCQYGFFVRGPNTASGSVNALTSLEIVVEDPDPIITAQPGSAAVTTGSTISFGVTAIGSSPLSYQWRHAGTTLMNGGNISGADTANLTISKARSSDAGEYVVSVSSPAGSVDSQPAQMTVLEGPCAITNEGEAFVIQSIAGDTNGWITLSWESCIDHLYEVQASDVSLALPAWTTSAFMLGDDGTTTWINTNGSTAVHCFYRVLRVDFAGDQDADGLSNLAEFDRGTSLRDADSDHDGMSDGWEVRYGLEPLDWADASLDLDDDGYTSLQEYQTRSRPNASYSTPGHLPRNLVGWWKLDEAVGSTALDASLRGNDGTLLGNHPESAWTAGYLSNAATLGGTANNWIEVPYRPSVATTQELTLMGWVKPSGQGILIANWDSNGQTSGNYVLQFGPDAIDILFSPAGNGTSQPISFNPNWTKNDWHHLAVTYADGANLSIYVDGERRVGQAVSGTFQTVANPILIGFPGLTEIFSVDDVRIYNRALEPNEIASFSRGSGLPVSMIVGQTANLRAFGASEGDTCQWSIVSGEGFFTNTVDLTTEFYPSWSGAVTVRVVYENSGVLHTNLSQTTAAFPSRSPLSDWNDDGQVQYNNNCYNFATDIRTDTRAQPGGPPFYYAYTCDLQTSAAISDGLQAGVDLADLSGTSELPGGHIVALLIWPNWDFHWVRMEADGTWSSKAGDFSAVTLDNAGQPITDPRTADFGPYQFCGFFWVGPDVNILHFPQ